MLCGDSLISWGDPIIITYYVVIMDITNHSNPLALSGINILGYVLVPIKVCLLTPYVMSFTIMLPIQMHNVDKHSYIYVFVKVHGFNQIVFL